MVYVIKSTSAEPYTPLVARRSSSPPRPSAAEDRPHPHTFDPDSGCPYCRGRRPFELPERLVEACLHGELVVFAGAGVSTENRTVLSWTLYDQALDAMDAIEQADAGLSFPAVMSQLEETHGRPELLQLIKKRFDYIDAFPGLSRFATRFHDELSTLFYIDTILTTNWDTYFETHCGAIPIVTPKDYAFWGLPGRKVFKLHGSISNVGSIIATEADYQRCYEELREGALGATLKHLLATKTIVFVGYSFRDDDFARIYTLMQAQLESMMPRPFIVTLDEEFDTSRYPGAALVLTDASYFLEELKLAIAERSQCFLPDERLEDVAIIADLIARVHLNMVNSIPVKKYPMVIYSAAYQDGLLDALCRVDNRRHTGEYSHTCDVRKTVIKYEDYRRDAIRGRDYWNAAYIEGYIAGLLFLIAGDEERRSVPIYFFFGAADEQVRDLKALRRVLAKGEHLHKTAYRQARKTVKSWSSHAVPHHTASLWELKTTPPTARGRTAARH